ncbi:MAG: DEAD/DEAH box helicase [Verrucomicrobiota bacterium]|nr:DEAD/DEAH box helicase [Verrucomicrobiota bacterium]
MMSTIMTFVKRGLEPALLHAGRALGYTTLPMIQQLLIPMILSGRDPLGRSPIGAGKTTAFALPLLQSLDESSARPQG